MGAWMLLFGLALVLAALVTAGGLALDGQTLHVALGGELFTIPLAATVRL